MFSFIRNIISSFREKFFKHDECEKLETIFPFAEDLAIPPYELTAEDILTKIKEQHESGDRYAMFYNSTISSRLRAELRQQRYVTHVDLDYQGRPRVTIYW